MLLKYGYLYETQLIFVNACLFRVNRKIKTNLLWTSLLSIERSLWSCTLTSVFTYFKQLRVYFQANLKIRNTGSFRISTRNLIPKFSSSEGLNSVVLSYVHIRNQ
jgi:hypothetical protein